MGLHEDEETTLHEEQCLRGEVRTHVVRHLRRMVEVLTLLGAVVDILLALHLLRERQGS